MTQHDTRDLHVTMPNGEVWSVPVHVIAHTRASYYSAKPNGGSYMSVYAETCADRNLILDWAEGDVNWCEVESVARKVAAPPASPDDLQDGWITGKKEIVSRPPLNPDHDR